jgi:DNA-binding FrmR family transcriptional regulator
VKYSYVGKQYTNLSNKLQKIKPLLDIYPRGYIIYYSKNKKVNLIFIKMAKKGPATIQDRINRIQGQLTGIEEMLNKDDSIEEVLTQIQAVISSLESTRLQLIKEQMKNSISKEMDKIMKLMK